MTKRRTITSNGFLACSRCGKLKHISEFYTQPHPYINIPSIDEDTHQLVDTWWGKPMSWCRQCVKDHRHNWPAGIDDLVT